MRLKKERSNEPAESMHESWTIRLNEEGEKLVRREMSIRKRKDSLRVSPNQLRQKRRGNSSVEMLSREGGEMVNEPEDGSSGGRVQPLELSRGGEVVLHDRPIDESDGNHTEQNHWSSESYDNENSSNGSESPEESRESSNEDLVDNVDVSTEQVEDPDMKRKERR